MKTKYLLFILVLGILGCGDKNKDDVGYIPPELIGKWKFVVIRTIGNGGELILTPYETGKKYDFWFKNDGTYEITDSTIRVDCRVSRYKIIGKYIYFSGSVCAPEEPVIVEQLTDSTLVINENFFEFHETKSVKIFE
jgi:hypothetical protein